MSIVVHGSHLTLHYSVAVVVDGRPLPVVDSFAVRPATLTVGDGQLAPALEGRLLGLGEGDERQFAFAPGEAYGARQPDLVQTFSRALFDGQVEPGAVVAPGEVVSFDLPQGGRVSGVLKSRDDRQVVVDFNHPLAGLPVQFNVRILGVL
jgi:FKBP-type peptidyl-prolyl cis-trans isomerase SlpA